MTDEFTKNKSSKQFKKAIVKGIPRQAVLKPAHALYRLQNQYFAIGDRVTMIQDSGGVPLSVRGVVIGLNAKSIDVVWDVPFMSGGTLGARYLRFLVNSQSYWTYIASQMFSVSGIHDGIQQLPESFESSICNVHKPEGTASSTPKSF